METWPSAPACPHNLDAPLPSYETMIVEALQNVGGTRGAAPKEIFSYMVEQWPLIPNFRPSASQALARAFKRGRLLKEGTLYSLNPEWTGGQTTPDATQPARHIAKKPASSIAPRPAPPIEHATPNADEMVAEATSNPAPFSPETKAVAQAIVSLLRPMAGVIQDLADAQTRLVDDTENASVNSTDNGRVSDGNVINTGFDEESSTSTPSPDGLEEWRQTLSSTCSTSTEMDTTRSLDIIPVDAPEASSIKIQAQQSLLNKLEAILKHLRDIHGPLSPALRM